ncbi:C-5 sterol desaturase [Puccinia sorghi]|uniref:C-5 sterol desaturase n=1 Tax=Puccinia sorghi TaxID=27349 RepID=A0A0L6UZM0_9BASI|nr:C-5 sterol desaturase [Puccinia sorghi]
MIWSKYLIHRFEHHPIVYKHIHKTHHKWVIPTPFASYAFHPLDGFLQSVPYHVFIFIFPFHRFYSETSLSNCPQEYSHTITNQIRCDMLFEIETIQCLLILKNQNKVDLTLVQFGDLIFPIEYFNLISFSSDFDCELIEKILEQKHSFQVELGIEEFSRRSMLHRSHSTIPKIYQKAEINLNSSPKTNLELTEFKRKSQTPSTPYTDFVDLVLNFKYLNFSRFPFPLPALLYLGPILPKPQHQPTRSQTHIQ